MPGQHTEYAFETAIEDYLTTAGGYEKGNRDGFDTERGLFVGDLTTFIRKTQPKEWEYLANLQKEKTEETLTDDLYLDFVHRQKRCRHRPLVVFPIAMH